MSTSYVALLIAEYLAAALCGAGLGATELLSRYRDAPFETLKVRSARNYLLINAGLAVVSLFLLQTIASGLIPAADTPLQKSIYEVLIAGFGGALLFRSAIVRSRIGDADIGVGPSFVIETLLATTDRQVDRQRAIDRADKVAPLMSDLNVAVVTTVLVPYSLSLLQNLSAQERQDIETKVESLVTKKVDEDVKPLIFGLMLVNLVGADALQKAKTSLSSVIDKKRAENPNIPPADLIKKVIDEQRSAKA
jgi:hypothetical protein